MFSGSKAHAKPMLLKVSHLCEAFKYYKSKPNCIMDAVVHPQCFFEPLRHRLTFDYIYLAFPTSPAPTSLWPIHPGNVKGQA